MPRPRTAMRKIGDVLRRTFAEHFSRRQLSASLGIPFTTVCESVQRACQAGLGWPLPEGLDVDRGLRQPPLGVTMPTATARSERT
jgi:hypothetical protein